MSSSHSTSTTTSSAPNQVRNANVIGVERAGYYDHSEYEEVRKGNKAVQRNILRHLKDTTVTVVLIGTRTASRSWVQYEIAESVARNNGLVGIQIHGIPAPPFNALWVPRNQWTASAPGPHPYVPPPSEMPVYVWDSQNIGGFRAVIEEAWNRGEKLRASKRARDLTMRPPPSFRLSGLGPSSAPSPSSAFLSGLGSAHKTPFSSSPLLSRLAPPRAPFPAPPLTGMLVETFRRAAIKKTIEETIAADMRTRLLAGNPMSLLEVMGLRILLERRLLG